MLALVRPELLGNGRLCLSVGASASALPNGRMPTSSVSGASSPRLLVIDSATSRQGNLS
jgi:hypothetical protein